MKIFLGVSLGFFLFFFVVVFRFFFFVLFFVCLFLFHVESRLSPVMMFLLFFFFLKFLVGMSSLFRVFIHVFGVNQCGV